MEKEILIEVIRALPSLLLYTVLIIVFIRLRKPLIEGLLPKITALKAFGFEANFVKTEIEKAAQSQNRDDVQVSPSLMRRIAHYERRPFNILWVDDRPDSIVYEAGILNRLELAVDFARTTPSALEKLATGTYAVVLSDIHRNQHATDGLQMLQAIRDKPFRQAVIFYVSELDRSKGLPPGAFGITDDPNELVHLVLDAVERL